MATKTKGKESHPLPRLDKILCLEGEWTPDLRREESVEPLLMLLQARSEIDYIHRRCGTRAEFAYYLTQGKAYRDYRIIYLSFHGAAGKLLISPQEGITIAEIAALVPGAFRRRLVYFGSCRTLKRPDAELKEFLHTTGAAAVAGYTRDVGWVEASAFELLFLYWAAYYKKPSYLLGRLAARYGKVEDLVGFRYYAGPGRANARGHAAKKGTS